MRGIRDSGVMARMEVLLDLYDFGEIVMRQNLRRRYPDADGAEIEDRLVRWLQKRDRPDPEVIPVRPNSRD